MNNAWIQDGEDWIRKDISARIYPIHRGKNKTVTGYSFRLPGAFSGVAQLGLDLPEAMKKAEMHIKNHYLYVYTQAQEILLALGVDLTHLEE